MNQWNWKKLKLLPLLCLTLLIQSCVGGMIVAPGHETKTQNQIISPYKYTKGELEKSRGKPQSITQNGDVWVYSDNNSWCGALIMAVVVPVPLMFPVCRNELKVTYKESRPYEVRIVRAKGYGAFCGPFITAFGHSGKQEFCPSVWDKNFYLGSD